MSASLVGSEMCIRDRIQSDLAAAKMIAMGALDCPESWFHLPPQTPPSPCLLYTSDAADDM
eukprot:9575595-Alexandrium_andersonii.AAC.1